MLTRALSNLRARMITKWSKNCCSLKHVVVKSLATLFSTFKLIFIHATLSGQLLHVMVCRQFACALKSTCFALPFASARVTDFCRLLMLPLGKIMRFFTWNNTWMCFCLSHAVRWKINNVRMCQARSQRKLCLQVWLAYADAFRRVYCTCFRSFRLQEEKLSFIFIFGLKKMKLSMKVSAGQLSDKEVRLW